MDLKNLSEKMSQLQNQIQDIEKRIKLIKVTKESGAGLIKVTMNGRREIERLDIDQSLLAPSEKNMLEDLIIAALNLAVEELEAQINREKQKTSADLLGSLGSQWQ